MRLIGNKTKLLGEIERLLGDSGIDGGTLIDIFSGTSCVGRHFKKRGYRVVANDAMAACWVQALASVEVSRYPAFRAFRKEFASTLSSDEFHDGCAIQTEIGDDGVLDAKALAQRAPLVEAVHYLDRCVEPCEGLIFRSFCPGGTAGRGYFTDEIGRKIDGILQFLRALFREGVLKKGEHALLLAALIDAADRVANISGTYGAFLKHWQQSARRKLELAVPEVTPSPHRNRAYREDANELVRRLRGDVLYIDPPYNSRQYPANYHVLEIIADYHTVDDLEVLEASLYGKTGLRPWKDRKSAYCVKPSPRRASGEDVLSAFTDLVLSSHVRHVVVSYNEEGLMSRGEIGAVLARFAGVKEFDFDGGFREVLYRRFRSDRDREGADGAAPRSYRVIDGKGRDEIGEWLFIASRPQARSRGRRRAATRQA